MFPVLGFGIKLQAFTREFWKSVRNNRRKKQHWSGSAIFIFGQTTLSSHPFHTIVVDENFIREGEVERKVDLRPYARLELSDGGSIVRSPNSAVGGYVQSSESRLPTSLNCWKCRFSMLYRCRSDRRLRAFQPTRLSSQASVSELQPNRCS